MDDTIGAQSLNFNVVISYDEVVKISMVNCLIIVSAYPHSNDILGLFDIRGGVYV
jgi:hypothetical protein